MAAGAGAGTRRYFLRDFEAGGYLDLLLISAVTTVLAIRFFLRLTGYPRVETESLHVAHMLWGGLLMLSALVILLSYVGRGPHQLSAFLGGVGFGAFIDELGKFITLDNDYFYKPAVALIYVIFILLYLTFRSIHREQLATADEFLVNAIQELERAAVRPLTREEKSRTLSYLSRADPDDRLVRSLLHYVKNSPSLTTERPRPFRRARERVVRFYRVLTVSRWFHAAVVAFFVGQLVLKLVLTALQILTTAGPERGLFYTPVLSAIDKGLADHPASDWAQLAASVLSAFFVILGVVRIRRSRLSAFRMFQRSILVSIFLTQVFSFYREELAALLGLAFNILVFLALRFMIERERVRPGRSGATRDGAAASA